MHAGEYFFMNPDHKLNCVLELEGMYLAIEKGFEMLNESSGGGFLNLSRCFLSAPLPEGMPFSKDAYHYSPAGNKALTRHIHLGCGLYL